MTSINSHTKECSIDSAAAVKKPMLTARQLAEILDEYLEAYNARSAWDKGVKKYAEDFILRLNDKDTPAKQWDTLSFIETLLDGFLSWDAYSYYEHSLTSSSWIARRLCTPAELRNSKNGKRKPNAFEKDWLETQARALQQACLLLLKLAWKHNIIPEEAIAYYHV